jgi:hypothetical protein
MKFWPRNFRSLAIVAALLAVAFVPGNAVGGPNPGRGKQPPANTTPPTVSGSAVVGSTLTGSAGTWTGSGIKFEYQWERCDSSGAGCANVAGATSTSLVLGDGDVGYRFRVSVTASNKNGSASATSDLSQAVAPAAEPAPPPSALPPTPTTAPAISGLAQEGQTLSASAGTWNGTQPLTYAYQWRRCDTNGAGCSAVSGATTQSYSLTSNDVGVTMRVEVRASNSVGTATAVSAETAVVASSLTLPSTPTGLTWAPPALSNPITVQVQNTGQACPSVTSPWQNPNQPHNCILDSTKDYILRLGHRTDAGGLVVRGGRNVVIIGGWITPRLTTTAWEGRGLTFWNQTGTVHVEGVLIDGAGDGILVNAPQARFQIENVRISVSAPNHDFSLNHPDVIQTWSGPAEMRIDRMTASSDYQGFYWYRDTSVSGTVLPSRVIQKRVNTLTDPTQSGTSATLHNVAYLNDPSITFSCEDCWMQTGWYSTSYRRKLQDSLAGYYNAATGSYTMPAYRVVGYDGQVVTTSAGNDVGRRQGDYMEWPGVANLAGLRWHWGTPPAGDFVPLGVAGSSYTSPGYGG